MSEQIESISLLESSLRGLHNAIRRWSEVDLKLRQKAEQLESLVSDPNLKQLARLLELKINEQTTAALSDTLTTLADTLTPFSELQNNTPDQNALDEDSNRDSDWLDDTGQLLDCLAGENVETSRRQLAVLFAETTSFTAEETERLLSGLRSYISENRFESNEESLVYVGAAIRKYSMCMSEGDFDSFADWLLPSTTDALSHQVELEFAKGIEWRLSRVPVAVTRSFPKLMAVLVSIAMDYTKGRLILQKNYASIALSTLVSIQLLAAFSDDESRLAQLSDQVGELRMPWFNALLRDRTFEAVNEIERWSTQLALRVRSRIDV